MAMASSLNPNAPLFIPAAYRQVEDYSPQWWELVQTTAWFRDHWVRQHDAALAALPDDLLDTEDLLFYAPPDHNHPQQYQEPSHADVLRAITSPRGAPSPWDQQQLRHYADKPAAQRVGFDAAARRGIHQPR